MTWIKAVLAFAAFSLAAVPVPLLLVRDIGAVTATIASVGAVRRNFWPMMLWAWLIAVFTAIGVATLPIGLVVAFPLIGHATWHAFAELVEE